MHILIIPSERYVPKEDFLQGIFQQHQAQALRRAGYKVGVISPLLRSLRLLKKGLRGWPRGIQAENDQGILVLRYYGWAWLPRIPRGQMSLWVCAGMRLFTEYVAQRGMPNLIHAHNALHAGALGRRIARNRHIPYVLTEHSSAYARGLIPKSLIPHAKEAFRGAEARLVVSPSLGAALENKIGDSARPWEWVPNILDGRFEKNAAEAQEPSRGGQQFRFLNVGGLTEIKGQADLLRAFASKFGGRDDVELRIGGDGPLRMELERLSHELKIDSQVKFLGNISREEVLAEMQACDVYVQSSHYETFGVALIEALSCGKPVIASACGGPECIVRKENGLLVPPRDVSALGAAMAAMRVNSHTYDTNSIRTDCLTRFGERAVVLQLTSVYRRVCSQRIDSGHGVK